ncbi:hypothetical protein QMI71_004658 [Salmonella enterica]|nr:hypothetical protein [Salmonella enterica]
MSNLPRHNYIKPVTSTTGHTFTVVSFSKVTIFLRHYLTEGEYVVVYTDTNQVRSYENGPVPCLGELTEHDIEILKNLAG